ncbi:MAG TPA: hypothetical protein VGR69_11290 [Candidatus Rubrimentiphilum sp.]|nr:hypothetical protein [Candidatus Rubrimentiphilum sp.]
MLRAIIIIIGLAMLAFGIGFLKASSGPGLPLIIFGCLIVLGTIFDQRYRARTRSDSGWEPTGERFVDPATGKLVDVYYDPKSGERDYRNNTSA